MTTAPRKAKVLIIDFSRVLLFPIEDGIDSLNKHHEALSKNPEYKLFDHFWLNHELLGYLEKASKNMPLYIFTDGKLHELPEIIPHLKDTFIAKHTVESLGLNKKQPESYISLASRIGVKPEEMIFVDDKATNIAAAEQAGVNAIQYTSNKTTVSKLDNLLKS
jgi:HAD superfamily hydrolase (TIGR01509 family)